jgi:hypothetical protein
MPLHLGNVPVQMGQELATCRNWRRAGTGDVKEELAT